MQLQPNADTIQSRIENALKLIYKKPIRINYAGRTDAGVHALSQYIDFLPPSFNIEKNNLLKALNSVLPHDIRILSIDYKDNDFHSRYSAVYRDYTYLIYNKRLENPFFYRYSWHIPYKLDIDLMKNVKHIFEGTKDFEFVANEDKEKNCTRNVHFLRIKKVGSFVIIHIRANGFLRGMVRNIVGSLVVSNKNTLKISDSENIIRFKREFKLFKAPPNGLFLTKVKY